MGDRDFDAEQSIRNRAYAIWEEDGRPDGKHLEHWQKAQSEVAHRAFPNPKSPPASKGRPARPTPIPSTLKSPPASQGGPEKPALIPSMSRFPN
jgi:hypothetical protein